jgi:predicted Zn-dependent protease
MKAQGSNNTIEFLSTHPVEGDRIKEIEKMMPEALKYYK